MYSIFSTKYKLSHNVHFIKQFSSTNSFLVNGKGKGKASKEDLEKWEQEKQEEQLRQVPLSSANPQIQADEEYARRLQQEEDNRNLPEPGQLLPDEPESTKESDQEISSANPQITSDEEYARQLQQEEYIQNSAYSWHSDNVFKKPPIPKRKLSVGEQDLKDDLEYNEDHLHIVTKVIKDEESGRKQSDKIDLLKKEFKDFFRGNRSDLEAFVDLQDELSKQVNETKIELNRKKYKSDESSSVSASGSGTESSSAPHLASTGSDSLTSSGSPKTRSENDDNSDSSSGSVPGLSSDTDSSSSSGSPKARSENDDNGNSSSGSVSGPSSPGSDSGPSSGSPEANSNPRSDLDWYLYSLICISSIADSVIEHLSHIPF